MGGRTHKLLAHSQPTDAVHNPHRRGHRRAGADSIPAIVARVREDDPDREGRPAAVPRGL